MGGNAGPVLGCAKANARHEAVLVGFDQNRPVPTQPTSANGEVQPICRTSLDVPPPCAPRVCPIMPPAVPPVQPPMVPPVGTSECVQQRILNEYTRQYEWRLVCR